MKLRELRRIKNNLTARYVAALGTVALLVAMGQLLVQRVLDEQASFRSVVADTIRLSATGESLSRLVTASQMSLSRKPLHFLERELDASGAALQTEYSELQKKISSLARSLPSHGAIGPAVLSLDRAAQGLLSGCHTLARPGKRGSFVRLMIMKGMLGDEQALRAALGTLATEFEGAAAERVSRLKSIELVLAFILLLVLVLQGVFVFRPAVSQVGDALGALKKSEMQLTSAREEALAALRQRSELVTNISHEIRNPLNAVLGMGELLAQSPLETSQRRYVEILRRSGHTILDLANDFLDFSRLEAGKIELERIRFSLVEIAERSLDIVSNRAEEKGLDLRLDLDLDLPREAWGDPKRLQQILVNLLGNAVKFTAKGEVVLRIEAQGDSGGQVDFKVIDTGIGVPPEKQAEIFESFVQVDSSITRRFGGSGLGLAICKRLASQMGGEICLKSRLGEGSVFSLKLPLEAAVEKGEGLFSDLPANLLGGLKIALVEHSHAKAAPLLRFLRALGAEPERLGSIREASGGRGWDVVLAGYDADLLDATDALSFNGKASKWVQFCSLRQMGQERPGGRGVLLPRPIRYRQLARTIAEAVRGVPEESPGLKVSRSSLDGSPRARILVAEDSESNRMVFEAYFKATPHLIQFAAEGEEAVRKFKESEFDLVFMDIQMPVLDGFGATAQIRSWEREQGQRPVPIIALTAFGNREEVEKCLLAGCTEHLTKPVTKMRLLETVQSRLRRKTGQDASGSEIRLRIPPIQA